MTHFAYKFHTLFSFHLQKILYALIPVEKVPNLAPVNPIFEYRKRQYRADDDDNWAL